MICAHRSRRFWVAPRSSCGWLTQHGLAREAASAKIVVESSLRMNAMIEDILDRSRTDATCDAQHRSAIDLVALVQQMIDQTIAPDDRRASYA